MGRYVVTQLFSDADAGANGATQAWSGWRGTFCANADTWNAAEVKLQFKLPDDVWVDLDATNAVLTENGMVGFECPPGDIRGVITGTPTNLSAWVITNENQ
jgi:hypothetical protein